MLCCNFIINALNLLKLEPEWLWQVVLWESQCCLMLREALLHSLSYFVCLGLVSFCELSGLVYLPLGSNQNVLSVLQTSPWFPDSQSFDFVEPLTNHEASSRSKDLPIIAYIIILFGCQTCSRDQKGRKWLFTSWQDIFTLFKSWLIFVIRSVLDIHCRLFYFFGFFFHFSHPQTKTWAYDFCLYSFQFQLNRTGNSSRQYDQCLVSLNCGTKLHFFLPHT